MQISCESHCTCQMQFWIRPYVQQCAQVEFPTCSEVGDAKWTVSLINQHFDIWQNYANRCWTICTIKTTTALKESHIKVWMMSFPDAGLSDKTSIFAPRPQLGPEGFNNFLKNWIYSYDKHLLHIRSILLIANDVEQKGWKKDDAEIIINNTII